MSGSGRGGEREGGTSLVGDSLSNKTDFGTVVVVVERCKELNPKTTCHSLSFLSSFVFGHERRTISPKTNKVPGGAAVMTVQL